ncbi:MAG TPA: hypothetical protein VEY70_03505 [Metabacillus sp.]|nr:hypothetical protein [Metabacillus sp.]
MKETFIQGKVEITVFNMGDYYYAHASIHDVVLSVGRGATKDEVISDAVKGAHAFNA